MKLGSLKSGRDGALVVVSRDLTTAVRADWVAPTLQAALDDWERLSPALAELAQALEAGRAKGSFALDPAALAAPLPRAYQWADGSAYVNHVELVRKARGAELPASFWTDPLIYQGGSDRMLGPCDDIVAGDEAWGIDFEAEVAVIVDDVPMGVSAEAATEHIKLLTILNDVSLRNLIPAELAKGFGFFHGKPPTAFAPVAVTTDELGEAWDGGKVNLPMQVQLNGAWFGAPEAGQDMTFAFPTLIAHAAKTRPLGAGSIVGSGTVSNVDRSRGSACLAEKRMLETIADGRPSTPFLKFGDIVRIEMTQPDGAPLFGAIEQRVVRYDRPAP